MQCMKCVQVCVKRCNHDKSTSTILFFYFDLLLRVCTSLVMRRTACAADVFGMCISFSRSGLGFLFSGSPPTWPQHTDTAKCCQRDHPVGHDLSGHTGRQYPGHDDPNPASPTNSSAVAPSQTWTHMPPELLHTTSTKHPPAQSGEGKSHQITGDPLSER